MRDFFGAELVSLSVSLFRCSSPCPPSPPPSLSFSAVIGPHWLTGELSERERKVRGVRRDVWRSPGCGWGSLPCVSLVLRSSSTFPQTSLSISLIPSLATHTHTHAHTYIPFSSLLKESTRHIAPPAGRRRSLPFAALVTDCAVQRPFAIVLPCFPRGRRMSQRAARMVDRKEGRRKRSRSWK